MWPMEKRSICYRKTSFFHYNEGNSFKMVHSMKRIVIFTLLFSIALVLFVDSLCTILHDVSTPNQYNRESLNQNGIGRLHDHRESDLEEITHEEVNFPYFYSRISYFRQNVSYCIRLIRNWHVAMLDKLHTIFGINSSWHTLVEIFHNGYFGKKSEYIAADIDPRACQKNRFMIQLHHEDVYHTDYPKNAELNDVLRVEKSNAHDGKSSMDIPVKRLFDTSIEALSAVNIAKEMVKSGKLDKALKIFEQAYSLAPKHPDVLNHYGEFLEKTQNNLLKAEQMYCQALLLSPKHSQALSNRKRALPLVEKIHRRWIERVEKKRDYLLNIPDAHAGLRRVKKEMFFKHIHHTVALEGNTFTLSQTRALVETRMAIAGKSLIEHNEILGLEAALGYINSSLVHMVGEITIDIILQIHKRVLGFVDPVEAGHFRSSQVFVGNYIPPAASKVAPLIEEFVEWINGEDANNLHPLELAAISHYKLVFIHPFYDGNGRTARLLMNLILMRAGYPPIIIKNEDKHLYYQHLETANAGDVRPFIRFIVECTEQTLNEFLWASSDRFNLESQGETGKTIILTHEVPEYRNDHPVFDSISQVHDDLSYKKHLDELTVKNMKNENESKKHAEEEIKNQNFHVLEE